MIADSGIENSIRLRVVRSVWRTMVSQLWPVVSTFSMRCCRTRRPGEGATTVAVSGPSKFSCSPDPIVTRWRTRLSKTESTRYRRVSVRWNEAGISMAREVILKILLQIDFRMQLIWYDTKCSRVLELNKWGKERCVSETINLERTWMTTSDRLF